VPHQMIIDQRRTDSSRTCHSRRGRHDVSNHTTRRVGLAVEDVTAPVLAAQLRETNRQMLETVTLLETLHATAPLGLGFIDRDFRIVRLNERLAAINGGAARDQIGKTVAEIVPQWWPSLEPLYRSVLDKGESVLDREMSGPSAEDGGGTHSWIYSYYPVRLGTEVIGIGIVVVDITERKRAERAHDQLRHAAVGAIAAIVEARDPYTAGHQHRVSELAAAIATEMEIDPFLVEGIRLAATIHDIGKIRTPAEILTRLGPLRPAEFELIKSHSRDGHDIVADIDFPWPVSHMILQHHERWDGSGYPDGVRGTDITVGARVIAVADVFDAMSSPRPYRVGLGLDAAIDEIRHGRGVLFDADAVDALLRLQRSGRVCMDQPQCATTGAGTAADHVVKG
jgi:putative nucleotidyltransferase with HDIG domain/PAS domain S-box-containing protein